MTTPKQLLQLATAAEAAGFRVLQHSDWPDLIIQRPEDTPILIKHIYTGRGRSSSDPVNTRLLQLLQDAGCEVRIVRNFDFTHLYPLAEYADIPTYTLSAATILAYQTKLRRLETERGNFDARSLVHRELTLQIELIRTKLSKLGPVQLTPLPLISPTTTSPSTETPEERRARALREAGLSPTEMSADGTLREIASLLGSDAPGNGNQSGT